LQQIWGKEWIFRPCNLLTLFGQNSPQHERCYHGEKQGTAGREYIYFPQGLPPRGTAIFETSLLQGALAAGTGVLQRATNLDEQEATREEESKTKAGESAHVDLLTPPRSRMEIQPSPYRVDVSACTESTHLVAVSPMILNNAALMKKPPSMVTTSRQAGSSLWLRKRRMRRPYSASPPQARLPDLCPSYRWRMLHRSLARIAR